MGAFGGREGNGNSWDKMIQARENSKRQGSSELQSSSNRSKQAHQLILHRFRGAVVRRNDSGLMPHLRRLVLESSLLIEDGQVLHRWEVLGIDLHRVLQR